MTAAPTGTIVNSSLSPPESSSRVTPPNARSNIATISSSVRLEGEFVLCFCSICGLRFFLTVHDIGCCSVCLHTHGLSIPVLGHPLQVMRRKVNPERAVVLAEVDYLNRRVEGQVTLRRCMFLRFGDRRLVVTLLFRFLRGRCGYGVRAS